MMRSKRWGALVKGNRFVVEADVLDKATSKRESTIDDSAIFASSPYLVTFKSTPKDFKPGTSTMIVVRYVLKTENKKHKILKESLMTLTVNYCKMLGNCVV